MKDELVLNNIGLIYKVMKDLNYHSKNEDDFSEVYGAGVVGLVRAVKTYDTTTESSTYLYKAIKYEIIRCFKLRTYQKRSGVELISLNTKVAEDVELQDAISSGENIEEDIIRNEIIEIVDKAVDKLKKTKYKRYLCEYYGIKQQAKNLYQIADENGVTYQNIQQHIKRGLKMVKKELEKEFKNEGKDTLFNR